MVVYNSFSEKRFFGIDKISICKQKTKSSQQILCLEWKYDNEGKYFKYRVRVLGKRFKFELRYLWFEEEGDFIRVDKNISKIRGKLVSKYMFDEGQYYEFSFSDELESITRKKRRFISGMFDQNVKYRFFYMLLMSLKRARVFYLGYFFRKRQISWKLEYNQDVRRFKRYENFEDYTFDFDNYYVSHDDNQEYIEYGSYLGDSYFSFLYFKMF